MTPAARGLRARLGDLAIRPLNLLVAAVLLIATLPVMALVALAVKATSPGPVFFRQPRVGHDRRGAEGGVPETDRRSDSDGSPPIDRRSDTDRRSENRGGRIFTMLKFRTMHDRGAQETPEVWASPDDPRVTEVGSFLRRHRLDELPQLFNVLRGDMNVVGPRPEQPGIFKELEARVPGYSDRQTVLPGITGWAQVNRGYDASVDDVRRKVELDLEYIGRRSPAEDLGIMARTLPVMISRRGSL